MKVIVSLYLITRRAFVFFFSFSFVSLLTWQHENKSHNAFQLATFFVSVAWDTVSTCVSAVGSRGEVVFTIKPMDGDGSNTKKITAAFYKCSPFKLLSWHLREQESRKKTSGWFDTWTSKHITLYVPPKASTHMKKAKDYAERVSS